MLRFRWENHGSSEQLLLHHSLAEVARKVGDCNSPSFCRVQPTTCDDELRRFAPLILLSATNMTREDWENIDLGLKSWRNCTSRLSALSARLLECRRLLASSGYIFSSSAIMMAAWTSITLDTERLRTPSSVWNSWADRYQKTSSRESFEVSFNMLGTISSTDWDT